MRPPRASQSALYRKALQTRRDCTPIPLSDSELSSRKGLARQARLVLFAAEGQGALAQLDREMELFLKDDERLAPALRSG